MRHSANRSMCTLVINCVCDSRIGLCGRPIHCSRSCRICSSSQGGASRPARCWGWRRANRFAPGSISATMTWNDCGSGPQNQVRAGVSTTTSASRSDSADSGRTPSAQGWTGSCSGWRPTKVNSAGSTPRCRSTTSTAQTSTSPAALRSSSADSTTHSPPSEVRDQQSSGPKIFRGQWICSRR